MSELIIETTLLESEPKEDIPPEFGVDQVEKALDQVLTIAEEHDDAVSTGAEVIPAEDRRNEIRDSNAYDPRMVAFGKSWPRYWVGQLLPHLDTLPPDIAAIVQNYSSRTGLDPGQQSIFRRYIQNRISADSLNVPTENNDQKHLLTESETSEHIVPAGILSSQEAMDLQMGSGSHGKKISWDKYWVSRLLPELGILPADVDQIVRKKATQQKLVRDEHTVLKNYVTRRVEVLKANVQKRAIMSQLKDRLVSIDRHESYTEDETLKRRIISYDPALESMYVTENNQRRLITLGSIAGDAEWGIRYAPDDTVPERLWRRIRKLSDVTEARQSVENVFNHELSRIHGVIEPTTAMSVDRLESMLGTDGGINGVIAERMAKNYLRHLAYDVPELELEVENSNALEDAELKYDFKVRVVDKRRGVAVQPHDMTRDEYIENKKRIGIQFTVSSAGGGKLKQVQEAITKVHDPRMEALVKKPVDDIVLVRLPFDAKALFQQWTKAGKPSGGPEQYLTREQKIAILQKVTEKYSRLNAAEIENIIA